MAENGDVVDHPAGSEVSVEGEPAEVFFVLLAGTLSMVRRVGADDVEIVRTDPRRVLRRGAVLPRRPARAALPATVRAMTDCRFLALLRQAFAAGLPEWFPMAVHLLEGLFLGQRNIAELVGQRERLLALGKLSPA